jgi:Na+/melibiose symporter-like transporter
VGWVKLDNFQRSDNKWGYAYLLTPAGITEKAAITLRFLKRKKQEYNDLQSEIAQLQKRSNSNSYSKKFSNSNSKHRA